MDIKSLPKDVRTHLRSGSNINSISQCVTELVLNSLDAKSTAIAVRINLLTFRIQVVDNGKGITKSNMNLIGIRYMTSKCQSLADLKKIKRFGFRGEAVASIRNISQKITIISRPDNVENTYSKTYENGKWKTVELVKQRPSKGTTVTVEGFMHNLPVRQKRINQNLDAHEIKRNLENLAIIHPNVSFNLRNDATGKVVFQSNKTQTVSQALTNLYPDISIEDLLEIKITKNKISISGLISKYPSTNSKLQFIYLNKRPIVSPKIQTLVNSLLLKSLINRKPSLTLPSEKLLNFASPIEKTDHPIYVINVRCPYSEVDLTLSPSKKTVEFKQWNVVLKCVEKAVVKLLEHENLIRTNSTKEEIDPSPAPSFKSQFGVSQIQGAVKSIAAKRKIVENATKFPQKYSKIDKDSKDSETEIYSAENNSATAEKGKKSVDDQTRQTSPTENGFNGIQSHARMLTSVEVHNEAKTGQRNRFQVLSSEKEKQCKQKTCVSTIDDANYINVLFPNAKPYKPKNRHQGKNSREDGLKMTNREKCFKILPTVTEYQRAKNVKDRPTLLGKIKIDIGKNSETNINQNGLGINCLMPGKTIGKAKSGKGRRPNKANFDIQNISSDDIVFNSPNIETRHEKHKNEPKVINFTKNRHHFKIPTNHDQEIYSTNTDKNIPTNIFDKHKNTQSLVLNSELNATKPNDNPLLNSTINTNILENQEKGKELIMDMFLKSTLVFPHEEPQIKEQTIKTVVVKTTKENLITERRNQNTTMMTVSLKLMSKKTIVTNSLHPICNLEENVLENDQNLSFPNNDDKEFRTALTNNQGTQNIRLNKNQCKNPKEKMISKCIQTTMIEHEKEFKIDYNCVTQSGPNINSEFTLCNSVPQNDRYNITFSKYFKKSYRKQNKPEKYCFPKSYFENDFNFNNLQHPFYNYDEPNSVGIGETNFEFSLNKNPTSSWFRQNRPNNGNFQTLRKIQIPQFGNNECLHGPLAVPSHNYDIRKRCAHNFPTDNINYENCRISNNYNRCNKEIFSNYDLNGKNFRKPITRYFSDYNFDFSNLNAFDETYRQFIEQKHNFERRHDPFLFVKRTNPSETFINQQRNNYNINNGCSDLTCDITVPLYQTYIPNKLNRIKQNPKYQTHFVQDEPLNNINSYITTNNRHEKLLYPTRNEMERYLHPKQRDENCMSLFNEQPRNQNYDKFESNGGLEEELYKSMIRDYGQQDCCQSVNNQEIDEQVREDKNNISKIPKLEKHYLWPEFAKNIFLQPSIPKQTSHHYKPFNRLKCNIGESDVNQNCYSPFFQKSTRRNEHHPKIFIDNRQKSECQHQHQPYQYHKTKNMDNRKNLEKNKNLCTIENQNDIRYVSPFFPKASNGVPIIKPRRTHLTHKNQTYVPATEVYANYENIEPAPKFSQTDDHQEITILVPPNKRIVEPWQQHLNHESFLLDEPQHQQFFSPKQNKQLFIKQNDFFLLEQKENQAGNSDLKQNKHRPQTQEHENLFVTQPRDQILLNSFPEQDIQDEENKLQHNARFLVNHAKNTEQPQSNFLFSTEKPQNNNWQFTPPNNNRNFHKKSKLSLKKFNTESPQQKPNDFLHTLSHKDSYVPQTHFTFQEDPEPTVKKFSTEPPNNNRNFHKKSKLSLKKFNTEPPQQKPNDFLHTLSHKNSYVPQTHFTFQQDPEPTINKFPTEPLQPNYYQNLEEHPKRYKLDLFPQSKQPFVDVTTPKCNNETEYSFVTPNINKSSTIDDTIEKVNLDDSETSELSGLKEIEGNFTFCSTNFKPALSSTRLDAVDENHYRKNVHPLNVTEEIERREIIQKKCDFGSDVIDGTPLRDFENFFVPSLNHIKAKSQQHHENDYSSKKSCSVLNISINAIKKLKLIQRGMADDCKLNKKSESELSKSNIKSVNSKNLKIPQHLLNNIKDISVVENQNQNNLEEELIEDEWIQKVNTFGSVFYIHKRTGMTSMFKPKQHSHFNLVKRIEFVPKGLSPIFIETKKIDASLSPTSKKSLHAAILENYENELNTIKWSNYIYDYNDANAFFEELYREKTKQFECHIPNRGLNEFPKFMVKLCNKTQAQSFTKDIFAELELIGQLDNKFIITMLKSKKLIVLFDQHAVHERVRLEQLLDEYRETENDNDIMKFKSAKCHEKIIITLTSGDVNIVTNFQNLFENLGLQYKIFENSVEITQIPTCIYKKIVGSKDKIKEQINSLIHEQIAMVMSTRGVSSKMPNVLQNIVNSEACRGAVKFGDKLTINECENLIKALSVCKLPFQCAHGRPTLIPIVSVKQNFEAEKMKPNLKKLKIK